MRITDLDGLDILSTEAFGMEEFAPTLPFPTSDISKLYRNGRFSLAGLTYVIEYVMGSTRSGVDPNGVKWSTVVPCAYGYIDGTKDADGEDVDVYINQKKFTPDVVVYVLDQLNPTTGDFDEHKCFLGYPSKEDALADYAAMVPDSEKRIGGVVSMSMGDFRKWVMSPETMKPVLGNPTISPSTQLSSSIGKKVEIKIPVTDKAPKIVIRKRDDGVDIEIFILSEFRTGEWGSTTNTILDLISNAGPNDTVLIGISSYGGELDLAARIASVIRGSKAKITTLSLGPVASAGCLTWCEGQTRYVSAGSYFMQHEAGCYLSGKTTQIAKTALVTSDYVKNIIFPRALQTGLLTEEEVDSMVDKGVDIYISAREAAARTGTEVV